MLKDYINKPYNYTGIDPEEMDPDLRLLQIMDEWDLAEMTAEIEDEFDISLPEGILTVTITIGELWGYIKEALDKR